MEIPGLVRERLGDEEIRAGVSLGEEDAVCLTPTRVLVYRGDGLLSDESVAVLPLDVERLTVSDGRRKTKFSLTNVDGTESFSVPSNRGEKVLELLLEGILRVDGVIETDESVRGVYRFSELTVIITDGRVVRNIGSSVWDEDFEEYPFAALTGLEFEEGSVATQIVLAVDGRPQRIKAPNDEAPKLRQTLQQALFAYHKVDSVAELNETVGPDDDGGEAEAAGGRSPSDLTLDDGIDPLVGGSREADETSAASREASNPAESSAHSARSTAPEGSADTTRESTDDAPVQPEADVADLNASQSDVEALGDQLETLTAAVQRQNEILEKQQRTIKQLIEELQQGR